MPTNSNIAINYTERDKFNCREISECETPSPNTEDLLLRKTRVSDHISRCEISRFSVRTHYKTRFIPSKSY